MIFPLSGVKIRQVKATSKLEKPIFSDECRQINQDEFAMQAEGIADFYIRNGNYIEYKPADGADPDWINLHLNGQVLAALLHQRKHIPFHASSFIYKNMGIMILGETGTGKSSITASFLLNGAGFLSDDLTPITIEKDIPCILPLNKPLKLRESTIRQLGISSDKLIKAEEGTRKFTFKTIMSGKSSVPLCLTIKIEIGHTQAPEFEVPDPAEKFAILRSEVCSWEMLKGMPATESDYFHQLVIISNRIKLIKITRSRETGITILRDFISIFLQNDL